MIKQLINFNGMTVPMFQQRMREVFGFDDDYTGHTDSTIEYLTAMYQSHVNNSLEKPIIFHCCCMENAKFSVYSHFLLPIAKINRRLVETGRKPLFMILMCYEKQWLTEEWYYTPPKYATDEY